MTFPTGPNPCPPVDVMVVDDEVVMCEFVAVLLESAGLSARTYMDPLQALKALKDEPAPRLLLTDFSMGPLNGLELIERARALHPGLATVLFSGQLRQETLSHLPVGPDLFIPKPFEPIQLIEKVKGLIAGRGVA